MTQTLATLPSSHRAPFSRVQASIRAAYHRSVNARKTAEFRAQLAATQPGGSLLPHHRVDPSGPHARKGKRNPLKHPRLLMVEKSDMSVWITSFEPGALQACQGQSHFSNRTPSFPFDDPQSLNTRSSVCGRLCAYKSFPISWVVLGNLELNGRSTMQFSRRRREYLITYMGLFSTERTLAGRISCWTQSTCSKASVSFSNSDGFLAE